MASAEKVEHDYSITLGSVEQQVLDSTNKFATETTIRSIVEQITLPLFQNYPQLKKDLMTVTGTATSLQAVVRKQHTEIEFLMRQIKELAEIHTQIEKIKIDQQTEKKALSDSNLDMKQQFAQQRTQFSFLQDVQDKFKMLLKNQDLSILQAQQSMDLKHIEQVNLLQEWLNHQGKDVKRLQTLQNVLATRFDLVEKQVQTTSEEVHKNIIKISEENHYKITNFELRFQKIDKTLKAFDLRSNSIQKIEVGLDDIQNRMIDIKLLTSFACSSMPILVHFQICEALNKVTPWSQKANLISFEKDKIKELKSYFDMIANQTNAVKVLNIRSKVYLNSFAENDKGVLPFSYAEEGRPTMRVEEAAIFTNLNVAKLQKRLDQFDKEKAEFKEAFDQAMLDKEKSSYLLLKHKVERLSLEQLSHLKDSLMLSFMKAHSQLSDFQPDNQKADSQNASPATFRKKIFSRNNDKPKLTMQSSQIQSVANSNPGSQRQDQLNQGQINENESAPEFRSMPDKIFIIKREDLKPYQRLDIKFQSLFQGCQMQVQKLQALAMGNFTKINLIQLETTKEHEFHKTAIDEVQQSLKELETNSTKNLFILEELFIKSQQKTTKKIKYFDEKINNQDELNEKNTYLLDDLKSTAKKNTNILREQILMAFNKIDLTKLNIDEIDKKLLRTEKESGNQQRDFSDQINKVIDKKIKDYFNSDAVQSKITKNIQENMSNYSVDQDDQSQKKQAIQHAKTTSQTNVRKSSEKVVDDDSSSIKNKVSLNINKSRLSRSETIQVKNVKSFETNLVIDEQVSEELKSSVSQDDVKDSIIDQSPLKIERRQSTLNKSVSSDTKMSAQEKRVQQAEKIKERKAAEQKKEDDMKAKQKAREARIEIDKKKKEEEEQYKKEEEEVQERRKLISQQLDEKQKNRQVINNSLMKQSKVIVMTNKFMSGLSNQNDKLNNMSQKIGSSVSSNNIVNFNHAKTVVQPSSKKDLKPQNSKNSTSIQKYMSKNQIIESNESQGKGSDEDEDFQNPFDFLKKQNEEGSFSPEKVNQLIKPQIDQIYDKIQAEVKLLTDNQDQKQATNKQEISQLQEVTQKLKNESKKGFSLLESGLSSVKKELEIFRGSINTDFSTITDQMMVEKREIMKLRRNMKFDIENEVNKIKALDKENSETFQYLKIKTKGLMDCLGLLIQDSMLMQMLSEQETIDRKQMVLTGLKKNHEILGTNQSAMSNNLGVISPGRPDSNNFWKLRNKNAKYDDVIQETRSMSQTFNEKLNIVSQSVISNDHELVNSSFIDRYKQTQNYNTLFLDRTTQNQSVQLIQQIKLACLNYTNTPIKYGPIDFRNQQARSNQLSPKIYEVQNGTDCANSVNITVQNSKDRMEPVYNQAFSNQIETIISQTDTLQKDCIYIELSHLEILSLKEILLLQANSNFSELPVNVEDIFKVKQQSKVQKTTVQIRQRIQNFNLPKSKQLENRSMIVPKNQKLLKNKQKKVSNKMETQSTLKNDMNKSMIIIDQTENYSEARIEQQNEENEGPNSSQATRIQNIQSDRFQLKSVLDLSENNESLYHVQNETHETREINTPVNAVTEIVKPKFDIPILKKLLKDKQNAISLYLKERPPGAHYSVPKSVIDSFVDDQIQKSLKELRLQEMKRQEAKNIEQSLKIMKMTIGLQLRIQSATKSNKEQYRTASLQDMLDDSVFDQVLQPRSPNDYRDKSKLVSGSISLAKQSEKINFGVKIGSKINPNQAGHHKLKSQLNMNSHVIPNVTMFRIMTPNQADSLQKRTRYDIHSSTSTVQKTPIIDGRPARLKVNIPDLCLMSVTNNTDKNNNVSTQNDDLKTRQQVSQSVTLKFGEISTIGLDNRPSTRPEKMTRQMAQYQQKTISEYMDNKQTKLFDNKKVNRLFASGEQLISQVQIKNYNLVGGKS